MPILMDLEPSTDWLNKIAVFFLPNYEEYENNDDDDPPLIIQSSLIDTK